jgi:sulfate adenylyltransferase
VPQRIAIEAQEVGALALCDFDGAMVAALHVTVAWQPDLRHEAATVFGTTNEAHSGVEHLLRRTNPWYLAGTLEVLEKAQHNDFPELRHTPAELRAELAKRGWSRVVAFNTRNPMHRVHLELTLRGARQVDAHLLVHPVAGVTQAGDVDPETRVRCYQALMPSYPPGLAMLSLLPLAMRMGGPREALWHAIIRRTYGATHVIVGRDPAGPRLDKGQQPFYGPYEGQELLERHKDELGIDALPFQQLVYVPATNHYVTEDVVPKGSPHHHISGTELRRRLATGEELPEWFTPAEVASVLRARCPARNRRGFTLLLTGLPGAGKTTITTALESYLRDHDPRGVSILDGEAVRHHLSSELDYTRAGRETHLRRMGFVAGEIARVGGIAICAAIAPYADSRHEFRRGVESTGGFVLVHVATPLETCERRDRKGAYARARAGLLGQFTGVTDPYEEPTDSDVVVDLSAETPEAATARILAHLVGEGYLVPPTVRTSPSG